MLQLIQAAHAGVISDAPTFQTIILRLINFLLSVFAIVAIIMLVVVGIRYIVSAGNKDEGYAAKEGMRAAIVGIVIALSSIIILKTIIGLLQ